MPSMKHPMYHLEGDNEMVMFGAQTGGRMLEQKLEVLNTGWAQTITEKDILDQTLIKSSMTNMYVNKETI